MDFFELIMKRESCRDYSDKEVSDELLLKCIEAARFAPSARNIQPWHFTLINDEKNALRVRKYCQAGGANGFLNKCRSYIIIERFEQKTAAVVGELLVGQDFSGHDVGMASAYITLAASELGLSSCIIGWFNRRKVKNEFKLAGDPAAIIAIGYAADEKVRDKKRKTMEEIHEFIK